MKCATNSPASNASLNSAMIRKFSIIFIALWCLILPVAAAEPDEKPLRPVFAAYTLQAGTARLADTYITPLNYKGAHYALDYSRYQAMRFDPGRFTMRLHGNLSVDKTHSPAGNSTMWDAMLSLDWSMMRRWSVRPDLTLGIGGITGIEAGAIYNARNSNNPVSAKGAWIIGVTGFATYRITLWRLPVTLVYQPSLPVTGIFFAPQYGESYYEIYLGDRSGLVHGAWWGNRFQLDNLLTADLHFGSTALRLGYSGRILTSKVNHIITRRFTHALTIGVSGEWLSLNPRKGLSRTASIINALY